MHAVLICIELFLLTAIAVAWWLALRHLRKIRTMVEGSMEELRWALNSPAAARLRGAGDVPTQMTRIKLATGDVSEVLDGSGNVVFADLIDHVAKEMVDADLPQFGGSWPWPDGDSEWEIKVRQEARELATVAIKAFMKWEGFERCERELPPATPRPFPGIPRC